MAWDKTKPPTSTALVSADHRANWAAVETAVGGVNLLADPTFLIWAAGDALAPTHWVLSGAGAAIARAGTGLGDTSRKVGAFTAKVTAGGGAVAILEQNLLPTASFDTSFQGLSVSMGAWVRATAASAARLRITDGVNTSFSAFHTGGGAYEFLTISGHSINAAATKLAGGMEVAISQVGYLSGPTFLMGQIPPAAFMPAPVVYDDYTWFIAGNQAAGANKLIIRPRRPGIVKDVQLEVATPPATQALIVDVNTWDGAAFTTMYTTKPQIPAAGAFGGARPDTTYARRCFTAGIDAATPAGSIITLDIDQVGVGTVGADLAISIRYLMYARPLEAFLAHNDVN
jgi:hypothetical protein